MFLDYRFYLFQLIVLASAVLATFSTFGFTALILIPLSLVLPLEQAIAISGIIDLTNGLSRGWFFKDKIDWKLVIFYGLPAIIFSFLASIVILNIDKELLKVLLGLTLVIYGILKLSFINFSLPTNKLLLSIGGGLSGILAGLFGAGGVFRTAFLSNYKLPTAQFIATVTLIEIMVDLSRTGGYISSIPLGFDQWVLVGVSIPVSFFGVYIASPFAKKLSTNQFKNLVSVMLMIFGLLYLFKII